MMLAFSVLKGLASKATYHLGRKQDSRDQGSSAGVLFSPFVWNF